MSDADEHLRFMRAALAFGRRSMGRAAPNPSVGALVVGNGVVLGRGVTSPGGRPHAEPIALAEAGEASRGATLYVTLEPCSHHGRTPPCVDAILASGIERVVVPLRDPDARVAGRGLAQLRAAGVAVIEGIGAAEAWADHLGHLRRVTRGRPLVTVKMAETEDRLAGALPGEQRLLITGPAANARVQMLRATHDGIVVGIGTALADDPLLTVRLSGIDNLHPTRIVLDTHLALPRSSRLVETAVTEPLLVLTSPQAPADREAALSGSGASVARVSADGRGLILPDALAQLAANGMTRLLCEGGPRLASALILAGLADRVVLFTSATSFDRPGIKALTLEARSRIEDRQTFALCDEVRLGSDLMRSYETVEAACLPV